MGAFFDPLSDAVVLVVGQGQHWQGGVGRAVESPLQLFQTGYVGFGGAQNDRLVPDTRFRGVCQAHERRLEITLDIDLISHLDQEVASDMTDSGGKRNE